MAVCETKSATIQIDHGKAFNVSLEVCIDSPTNGETIPGTGSITVSGHGHALRVSPSGIVVKFNGQASATLATIILGPNVPPDRPRSFTWSWNGTIPASGSTVTIAAEGTAPTDADSTDVQ